VFGWEDWFENRHLRCAMAIVFTHNVSNDIEADFRALIRTFTAEILSSDPPSLFRGVWGFSQELFTQIGFRLASRTLLNHIYPYIYRCMGFYWMDGAFSKSGPNPFPPPSLQHSASLLCKIQHHHSKESPQIPLGRLFLDLHDLKLRA
jgi:hypothetical protein